MGKAVAWKTLERFRKSQERMEHLAKLSMERLGKMEKCLLAMVQIMVRLGFSSCLFEISQSFYNLGNSTLLYVNKGMKTSFKTQYNEHLMGILYHMELLGVRG